MAWYKTGTVAVTNASTTVTGTGTNFVSGAQVGDGFLGPNELLYEITAINSATSLTIAPAYGGATASSQSYAIAPTQGLVASLASDVTDLITDYQSVVDNAGAGKFGDGSAASPAIRFTNDQDTGFFRDTANEIAFATAGVKRGEFTSSGIQLLDGQKFIAGTGNDLQIYHDGSHSYVTDQGTGRLYLQGTSNITLTNADGTAEYANFANAGAASFRHNNNVKLATTSTGVSITGAFTATDGSIITVNDNSVALNLVSTDTDASQGPILRLYRNAVGAASDVIGTLHYYGQDVAGNDTQYAEIEGRIEDATNGAEDGTLVLSTMVAGTSRSRLNFYSTEAVFNDGSQDINFRVESNGNANMLFVDGGNNRVGIGHATPDGLLHLKNTDSTAYSATATDGQVGVGPTIYLENPANSNSTVGGQIVFGMRSTEEQARIGATGGTAPALTFGTGDAEAMRLTAGNLLVGKTSTATGAGFEARSDGQIVGTRSANRVAFLNRLTSDGDIIQFAKDGSTLGNIGTESTDTTLQADLYIKGRSTVGGTNANNSRLWLLGGDSGIVLDGHTNSILPTDESSYEDGRSDIGSADYRFRDLYLSGDTFVGEPSTIGAGEAGVTVRGLGQVRVGRAGTASVTLVSFNNGNGEVGTIVTSGSATAYNTSSDYRLKTDAQPMTGATDRLKQLNPVNFEWIADSTRVDGFLAHEAQAVVPEAVTGAKDAMRDEEYEVTPTVLDDDGNVITEAVMGTRSVPDYQGIDQSKLVPLLVATIKELEARITALENA